MKCFYSCQFNRSQRVAPHVGAWIEILSSLYRSKLQAVAPHVGAWIEINCSLVMIVTCLSLPMWGRGLKWCIPAPRRARGGSLPMWGRGLKCPCVAVGNRARGESLPMWGRGLKSFAMSVAASCGNVAPHVGAWIEISRRRSRASRRPSRSPCGGVD